MRPPTDKQIEYAVYLRQKLGIPQKEVQSWFSVGKRNWTSMDLDRIITRLLDIEEQRRRDLEDMSLR